MSILTPPPQSTAPSAIPPPSSLLTLSPTPSGTTRPVRPQRQHPLLFIVRALPKVYGVLAVVEL